MAPHAIERRIDRRVVSGGDVAARASEPERGGELAGATRGAPVQIALVEPSSHAALGDVEAYALGGPADLIRE
jgi:hypothetical protein